METKIDSIEKGMTLLKQKVKRFKENASALERKTDKLDEALKLMKENVTNLGEEPEEVQISAENTETYLKKDNINIRGLQEQVEGDNSVQYMQNLFTCCMGADCDIVINGNSACQIGQFSSHANPPEILLFSSSISTPDLRYWKNFWEILNQKQKMLKLLYFLT